MIHTPYNPSVRLLCQKCRRQTAHIMIGFSNDPLSALTLNYECQECGEVKKVFDLNTLPELKVPVADKGGLEETKVEAEVKAIPLERGPQIDR